MLNKSELRSGPVSVVDYRCTAGPAERPFTEVHRSYSVSYVRKGSFGYRTRGQTFELVAGSVLVGNAGDECLAFHLERRQRMQSDSRLGEAAACRRCRS